MLRYLSCQIYILFISLFHSIFGEYFCPVMNLGGFVCACLDLIRLLCFKIHQAFMNCLLITNMQ